jgi:hypothetical protein
VRVFFDNCTSPVLAETLNGFLKHRGHDTVHLRDYFASDTPDIEWIKALALVKVEVVVITGDARIHKNKPERVAFRSAGLRGFVLNPAYHKTPQHITASVLIRRWPDIEDMVSRVEAPFLYELPINHSSKLKLLPL